MQIVLGLILMGSVVWIIQKTANMLETQQPVEEAERQSNASLVLLVIAVAAFVGLMAL